MPNLHRLGDEFLMRPQLVEYLYSRSPRTPFIECIIVVQIHSYVIIYESDRQIYMSCYKISYNLHTILSIWVRYWKWHFPLHVIFDSKLKQKSIIFIHMHACMILYIHKKTFTITCWLSSTSANPYKISRRKKDHSLIVQENKECKNTYYSYNNRER